MRRSHGKSGAPGVVGFAMAAPVGEGADVGGSLPAVKNGCAGGRRNPLFRHPYPTNPTRDCTKIRFLSIFGDRLKSHIIYSPCTPRLHHVGEDKCFPHARASHTGTTVVRTGLPWHAPPRRMAGDLPRTCAIRLRPAAGSPRGYAASAWVCAGTRGQAVCAGPSRGTPTKRQLRRSRWARP